MASARRSCRNKPDVFCYICGEYTIAPNRKPVTSFITRAFGIKLADQDKAWAPHLVCKACTETLRRWSNGKRSLKFGIPMVWREPTNYVTGSYFCAVDVTEINRKNRDSLKNHDLQSARRPVAHCDEIPVPIFGELPDISDEDASSVEGHKDEEEVVLEDDVPHPFSQKELNDLVRDLSLSKDSAELLASTLKEKNSSLTVLRSASSVFSLQWRTRCTVQILRSFCSGLCHSTNQEIGDCSLTAASNHWNVFCYITATSLPLCPSLTRLRWRRSMKRWSVCWRKLVMISISGLFVLTWRWWTFCWDNFLASPSTHVFCTCGIIWTVLSITRRMSGIVGGIGALQRKECQLVDRDRILFQLLHIKLGLIKQFTKALDKDGDCFTYLCQAFPGLTMEKLKAGIFDSPQIWQLFRDPDFENSMNEVELEAWKAFFLLVKNFLGINKARNYVEPDNNMVTAFRKLGCNMSVKMH